MPEIISVIIPVYNLENYIKECIESILEQTYQNFQIILVDDCSLDNSVAVIEELQKKDARIQLIRLKENRGAGYARNVGMDNAKGKYLLFLDGDDFFEKDMLEKLYVACDGNNADIAICNMYMYDNKTGTEHLFDEVSIYGFDKLEVPFRLNAIKEYAFQFIHEIAWNKMFRREFVVNAGIRFQEQHNANDQFFVFANLLCADKIVKIMSALIHYRTNINGQLSKSIMKNPLCIFNATLATADYMKMNGYMEDFKSSFNTYVVNRLIFSMDKVSEEERKRLYDFYYEKGWEQLGLLNCEREEFSDYRSYLQYVIMKNQRYSDRIYKSLRPEMKWDRRILEKLFNQLSKTKCNTVLWGVGVRGQKMLDMAELLGFEFQNVVDKNTDKIGNYVKHYRVEEVRVVKNNDCILITNTSFVQSIKQQIKRMGRKCILVDVQMLLSYEVDITDVMISTL